MQLTLVPPSAYPVPQALHTHELPPPTFRPRRASKVPEPWQRARRQLASIDLRQPDPLAADASAWWQFAVQAVEWNLELDEVIVTLVDGTQERWDLSPQMHPRSSPMAIDSDSEDAPGSPDLALLPPPPPTGTDLPPSSRWHPDAVSTRLRHLAIELRSAYEDLGTAAVSDPAAPDISTENDFRLLMLLAADPSRQVPFEWSSAQTMYEYAMMGVDEDEHESAERGAGRARSWRDELRRPSQGRRLDVDDPAESDPFEYTGQFRSRRRNTARDDQEDPGSRAYDYLSVIELLSEIRTYLCELFPATIIPALRERLPPTYTLWAANGAIVWCRREAIGKARDAADLIVELLDDDGDHFDCTSKTASPVRTGRSYTTTHDIIVEDTCDMLSDSSGGDEWQAEERRQDRLVHNPLRLLRDDYELRKWCINASEQARMLEMADTGSDFVSSPDWLRPVPSLDVATAFEADSSDSERNHRRRRRLRLSHADPSSSPPTSPPAGDSLPGLSRSDSETETSDLDELADEDIRVSARRLSDDFFYPPDPLGEGLLPRRLPKELVERNLQRGPELEEHREQLHHTLNQIAGLQSKIADLHGLVQRETKVREEAQEERVQKEKPPKSSTTTSSRLKGPRTIPGPPPNGCRRRHPPKAGPPLRQQTGDRALERSLDEAYRSVDSPDMPKRVKASRLSASLSRQLPRKRQRHNLETYSKLAAMSTYVLSDGDDDDDSDEQRHASTTKRRRLTESTASEGKKKKTTRRASSATREARPKRPALVRGTRLQQSHGPDAPENGDLGALQPADRHTAVVGLSNRRRQVLQALTSDTGLGDSSLGSLDSNWLEAEISVDDGSTEEHEIRKNDEPKNDDEVDELEEVEIDGLESRSEEDWPGLASQITSLLLQADGPAPVAEEENLDLDLEAPTRFPSPPLGAPPSSSTRNFVSARTAGTTPPPFSSSRLPPSPAYPVSAERSWQREYPLRPTSSSTPRPPLPLVEAHDLNSVLDGQADQQEEEEQHFVVPAAFGVPRARVRSLISPPGAAAAHRDFSAEDVNERARNSD